MKNKYTRSIKKDVAIIGMSAKFPKSDNLTQFWENLEAGSDLTRFYSDEELEKFGIPPELLNNPNYVKSTLFINNPGSFDYAFFGYTKEEAALMDPQIRLMHEQVWIALEDAGYNPLDYQGKIGSFLSASDNVNWRSHVEMNPQSGVSSYMVNQIADRASISRLISYKMNFRGPSIFIDTACSSSLVAVHSACRSLLLRECSIAISGGVRLNSSVKIGYLHEEGMIFSKNGRCSAFDKDSSGTVSGEGAGVVVLKRLEDALKDNDHIYCIIRGSVTNNDGNQKVGFTAPSISGQADCIRTAQKFAEVDPSEITYIEAHGTGTKLGDPVEVEALNKAFNNRNDFQCAIGSVKTMVGHLDAGAGIAGLLKTALALNYKILPASLNFNEPNPEINFKGGPFYVNSTTKIWDNKTPRIAGVSSFGIGGTNAHIIMEEAPALEQENNRKLDQLLLFSAKSKTALERMRLNMISFLEKNQEVNLADLAYTLQTGRATHKYRKSITTENVENTLEQLYEANFITDLSGDSKSGIVFMFSGQGSQYFKMAKICYEEFSFFKALMDRGFTHLINLTGIDHKDILGYNDKASIDDKLINNTRYTQPLLFLVEYSYAKFLIELGVRPDQMIGHSLGEYVAACIAEVFTLEEGLTLLHQRGLLMSELDQGDMLNVQLGVDEVSKYITDDIGIAAINATGACVISGNKTSIANAAAKLVANEITFLKLRTSHAFHSEMMDSMMDAYKNELGKVNWSIPSIPFVSCISGKVISNEQATSVEYWMNHLRETVQFSKGLDFLLSNGYKNFIEIGASKTLLSFLRQHENFSKEMVLTSVVKHPMQVRSDLYYLLNSVGILWSAGYKLKWDRFYQNQERFKIALPTYPFDKEIFPAKVDPFQKLMELTAGQVIIGNSEKQNAKEISKFDQLLDELNGEDTKVKMNNSFPNQERPDIEVLFTAAKTETESKLCDLWQNFFGYDKIGINDDFFELGGDSLKGMTILKRIHKEFDVEISTDDFFNKCTIKLLSDEIDLVNELKQLNKLSIKSEKSNQLKF